MNEPIESPVLINFRIPGPWANPGELLARLDSGIKITPRLMTMPDGSKFHLTLAQPDQQFKNVFLGACRRSASETEQAILGNYRVNILMAGQGGSPESARKCMLAAAAFVEAGAAGIFCDNSLLAHGGEAWQALSQNSDLDALTFAFVNIVDRGHEIETVGMHAIGKPDIKLRRLEHNPVGDERHLIDWIRSLSHPDRKINVGDMIEDLEGQRFHATKVQRPTHFSEGPMHNPFGCVQLVSQKEIAENN